EARASVYVTVWKRAFLIVGRIYIRRHPNPCWALSILCSKELYATNLIRSDIRHDLIWGEACNRIMKLTLPLDCDLTCSPTKVDGPTIGLIAIAMHVGIEMDLVWTVGFLNVSGCNHLSKRAPLLSRTAGVH